MSVADELAARFAQVALAGHAAARAEAEARVVEWRWSRGLSRWDEVVPLAAERDGMRLGQLTRERRRGRFDDQDQIGLDSEGRVAVVRSHDGGGGPDGDSYITRTADRIERLWFVPDWGSRPWRLLQVQWVGLDDEGRPVWSRRHREEGPDHAPETYVHDELGRLVEVRVEHLPRDEPGCEAFTGTSSYLPRYDDAGRLVALDHVSDNAHLAHGRVWRLPSDRARIARWTSLVRDRLPGAVLEAVAGHAASEPLAAVCLHHSVDDPLHAWVAVLREREPLDLNPAQWPEEDFELPLELDDELREAIDSLALEWQMSSQPGRARRLLVDVTKRLNELPWPVPTTDFFFVFAGDLEETQTQANLRRAVPRDRLTWLRRHDLLE